MDFRGRRSGRSGGRESSRTAPSSTSRLRPLSLIRRFFAARRSHRRTKVFRPRSLLPLLSVSERRRAVFPRDARARPTDRWRAARRAPARQAGFWPAQSLPRSRLPPRRPRSGVPDLGSRLFCAEQRHRLRLAEPLRQQRVGEPASDGVAEAMSFGGHECAGLRQGGRNTPDALLKHVSPLSWKHINLSGNPASSP